MIRRTLIHALATLALLALAVPVAIAEENPPPLAEVWLVTPKEGHNKEFLAALKEHMALRTEQGDTRTWRTYTPTLGDNLQQVAIRNCCVHWADLDAYNQWERGNQVLMEQWETKVSPHVASYGHYYARIDWANSHWSEAGGPYRLFAVREFDIKPGHGGDFEAAREKMSQIALNQGWATDEHAWLWTAAIGGQPRASIVIPYRDYSAIGGEQQSFERFLAENLGSEEAAMALLDQFQGATRGSFYQIWELQSEFSMQEAE